MLNRVQRILALAACQATTLLFMGSAVAADQTILPAQVCQPFSAPTHPEFDGFGSALSYSSTAAAVYCGLGQDNGLDANDDVRIYFDDNNGGTDAASHFVCWAYEMDEDWSSYIYTGHKYGCGTAGGCDLPPAVYAAENYITLSDLQHGGAYSIALTCYIPGAVGGVSVLKSFVLDEQ